MIPLSILYQIKARRQLHLLVPNIEDYLRLSNVELKRFSEILHCLGIEN